MSVPREAIPPAPRRAADIFAAALELDAAARAAYLDAACAGDEALRADVDSLLAALPAAQRLFDGAPHLAAPILPAEAADEADPALGLALGPWRLVRRLATGGMGAVYLGQRVDTAFRKQVAVKLIRPWLDTAEITERFRRERQVLADLDHPHIARLLDGGAAPDGRPYLVMEYVDGLPIDRHADELALPIAERLRLFLTVCDAVQHAHGNLVVHRDLKPSNILVDRQGQVKLLDFGIAKVIGGDTGLEAADVDRTLTTAMTPRYASPEQVLGRRVTTATDVYSLGVLLHELLSGAAPYAMPTQLTPEAARVISETEPTRPSRAAARAPNDVAQRRGQSPARLSQQLAGDLDNIVLKALRKEPDRRYGTVAELATDIRRHLDGLPVLAAPDRLGYRAGKFVRRHRALVLATAATVVALAVALAVSVEAWQQARRQTRAAERLAYENSLAAAESALRENAVEEATERLAAAPAALRGWEWRHLTARLDRSLVTVKAHVEGITCVRFAPGDATLFSAAIDSTVREWDTRSGAPRRVWGPLAGTVESLAVAPDGAWLAAGLGDGRVVLLDAAGASPTVLHEGAGWASVAADPTGARLAVAEVDGSVRVWEVGSRRVIRGWQAHSGFAQVAWSPRGDLLVTGGADGAVKMWNAATGELQHAFTRHTRRVYCLAVSADGRRVVSGGMDQLAIVHDAITGEHLATFHGHTGTVAQVAFTPDGGQVLSCSPDGRFVRWDARSGAILSELRGHRADVSAIAASADGRWLASADWNGTLKVWDADATDVETHRLPSPPLMVMPVTRLALDPSGDMVAAGSGLGELPVWPLPGSSRAAALLGGVGPVAGLAYAPDGRFLVVASAAGLVYLIDSADWSIADTLQTAATAAGAVAIAADGRRFAVALGEDRMVFGAIGADGRFARPPRVIAGPGRAPRDLLYLPGDVWLAAAGADSAVHLLDPSGQSPPQALRGHGGAVLDLCADPTGRRLASVDATGTLRLWSLPDGAPLAAATLGRARCAAVAWSPDGSRLAVGGIDGAVRLLDAGTLRELVALRGHVARITALAFGPGESVLVSGSRDGTVRVWTAPAPGPPRHAAVRRPGGTR